MYKSPPAILCKGEVSKKKKRLKLQICENCPCLLRAEPLFIKHGKARLQITRATCIYEREVRLFVS